jgi:hypothetical protein
MELNGIGNNLFYSNDDRIINTMFFSICNNYELINHNTQEIRIGNFVNGMKLSGNGVKISYNKVITIIIGNFIDNLLQYDYKKNNKYIKKIVDIYKLIPSDLCNKSIIPSDLCNKSIIPSDLCNKSIIPSDLCNKSIIPSDLCNKSIITCLEIVSKSPYYLVNNIIYCSTIVYIYIYDNCEIIQKKIYNPNIYQKILIHKIYNIKTKQYDNKIYKIKYININDVRFNQESNKYSNIKLALHSL